MAVPTLQRRAPAYRPTRRATPSGPLYADSSADATMMPSKASGWMTRKMALSADARVGSSSAPPYTSTRL